LKKLLPVKYTSLPGAIKSADVEEGYDKKITNRSTKRKAEIILEVKCCG